jgi:homoserine trans-succinylase
MCPASRLGGALITHNTPADHIRKFYSPFTDIRDKKFDGFIVTGINALKDRVEQETLSRWKSPRREDILKVPALEIVANSDEAGPNMLVESAPLDDNSALFPRRVYILNHPKYETDTLGVECHRDS